MPRIQERTVYAFAELSDDAKERARNDYRETGFDYDWHEYVIDDAMECGKLIGLAIDRIYFSGFASQGDGACFTGSYSYAKGGAKTLKAHAPEDTELHRIADELQKLQRRAFYGLSASIEHRGHYYHKYCTDIEANDDATAEEEEAVKELLRDFMEWIYRRLEKEWEWLTADEQIQETIESNGREFYEDGSLA